MGDSIPRLIFDAMKSQHWAFDNSDILVVSQKIVSKAEGRTVDLRRLTPSNFAHTIAKQTGKDARHVEAILRESKRIIRMKGEHLITETKHGFICANSGVDMSNVSESETVTLLPEDPDESADKLRAAIRSASGKEIAVVISDTFGRPWRMGQVNVAIGVSGLKPTADYRGSNDMYGYTLKVTEIAVADEIAAAAELVMGKSERVPAVIITGFKYEKAEGRGRDLIRPEEQDLFR